MFQSNAICVKFVVCFCSIIPINFDILRDFFDAEEYILCKVDSTFFNVNQ